MACALPPTTLFIVGFDGTEAFAVYERGEGFVSAELFVAVRVIEPAITGVIVNVCDEDELLNVKVVEDIPVLPEPVGAIMIVPVKASSGITVKFAEGAPTLPDDGPEKVKDVAPVAEVVVLELTDPCPIAFTALTRKS